MKYNLIYIIIISFFISCTSVNKPKKPKNLISKEQMVNVLLDMSLLSSAKGINKSKLENNGIFPESFIFNKHQIDSLQFAESNRYYTYHLKEYQDIITKVEDSLKKLREDYSKLVEKEEKETRKKDSIRRAEQKNKSKISKNIKSLKNKD
ncbi:DUF4296 domain-containing protein [Flavobacteriaceae bacterium LYZ1037]|nr:DUF4296 domain-containing protein [Flavobacteriaceae bacterium LYZ1037]